MRRTLALLTLGILLGTAPVLNAGDEFPHLEFARGLRAKNYADLARDYLRELAKRPQLPQQLARLLPLEIARADLDLSSREPDPIRRRDLFDQARRQFAAFVQANPGLAEAVAANLDLARVTVAEARAAYADAQKGEGPARWAALRPVRALFVQAGQRLQEAARRIDAGDHNAAAVKQARLDAELEMARNFLDQMLTYDLDKESVPRGELGKRAVAEFKALAKKAPDNPAGWLARAWVIRGYDELDSLPEAEDAYRQFEKAAGGRAVEPAARLARGHYLQILARRDPGGKDRETLAEILKAAADWLRDYPAFRFTPEGQAVRYQLAQACRREAERVKLNAERTQEMLAEAERLYAALEQEDGEYAERAGLHKVRILLARSPKLVRGAIDKLPTFQECYLRAQVESLLLGDESKERPPDAKKVAQQRRKHSQNIVAALERGFALPGQRISPRELIGARFLLIHFLMETKELRRAAALGEDLARRYPYSRQAASAGAYAVYAYAQLAAAREKADAPQDAAADRDRLRKLAQYVEATWPNELAADLARHQLGLLALRQNNYAEAAAVLARVSPHYGQYAQAQFQLASAALQALKEKLPPPKGQPGWDQQASAAFARIPEPTGDDPEALRVYLYGKLELAKAQYAARQYDAMGALLAKLRKQLALERDEKVKAGLTTALDALGVYAKYGQADAEFRSHHADRYARVRALLDPLVAAHRAKQLPALDPKLVQGILGLVLRADVLDGQPAQARAVLELLQQSAGDYASHNALIIDLVQQLRGQLDGLRKKGPAFQPEVEKTVAQFTAFLDDLAKSSAKGLKPEMIRFLAYSYSGLDKHAEAAALLAKVSPPAAQADEKFYHATRIMYAHELRLANKYDEAAAALKAVAKTEFGKRSLEAKKEEALLQEDQDKFAAAANRWNQVMGDLRKLKNTNPQLADQYHDCLFHYIHCVYQ
jgi:hypothetical protein